MDLTVSGMWHSMGLMARLIVITLFIMSATSLVITAERLLFFRKSKADSIKYAMMTERMLAEGRLFEAAQQHAGKDGGYLGRVMESGLKAFARSYGSSREFVLEAVGRALEKQTQRELQTMKRGQGVVATISSTAPFVGLLGTVMGIVTSFQSMAASGSGGLGSVSGGISEALVTTAIGLLVAIPAVFSFNWLQSWIDGRGIDLAESCNDLMDTVGRAVGESKAHGQQQSHAPASHMPEPRFQQEHQVRTQSGVVPSNRAASQTAQHMVPSPQQMHNVYAYPAQPVPTMQPPSVMPNSYPMKVASGARS
jgi:biopolymer transport protein ExbB/biopolymer transport protein TolQ